MEGATGPRMISSIQAPARGAMLMLGLGLLGLVVLSKGAEDGVAARIRGTYTEEHKGHSVQFIHDEDAAYRHHIEEHYSPAEDTAERRAAFSESVKHVNEHNRRFLADETSYTTSVSGKLASSPRTFGLAIGRDRNVNKVQDYTPSFKWISLDAASSLDWRAVNATTGIQDQASCSACWAFPAVAAVESAWGLALGAAPPVKLSEQAVVDCSGNALACVGGWPEEALDFMSRASIPTAADYPYAASQGVCQMQANGTRSNTIDGYQRVPAMSRLALMKAVTGQPVIVYMQASLVSFQLYSSGIYSDPSCGTELNHAVLIVGYGWDDATGQGYWIGRNSWGASWGMSGYFYIQMAEGAGLCGMTFNQPLYPIVTNPANPCATRPCGSGICIPSASNGTYSCDCSGVATPSVAGGSPLTCLPLDACAAVASFGLLPCGNGTCINNNAGGYTCKCQPGFASGYLTDGSLACVPNSPSTAYHTVKPGDDCASIADRFNVTLGLLRQLNRRLNCKNLAPGTVLLIASSGASCLKRRAVSSGETCSSAGSSIGVSATAFAELNPATNCSAPLPDGSSVCTASPATVGAIVCLKTYKTGRYDSCAYVCSKFSISYSMLFSLNPTIPLSTYCQKPYLPYGLTLCVCSSSCTGLGVTNLDTNGTPAIGSSIGSSQCTNFYFAQPGDTCFSIASAASMEVDELLSINPGLQCQYLCVGEAMCLSY